MEAHSPNEPGGGASIVRRFCVVSLPVVGCLVAFFGWIGWTGEITGWQHWLTICCGLGFAGERLAAHRRHLGRRGEGFPRRFQALLALVVISAAVMLPFVPPGSAFWWVGGHLAVQLGILVSGFAALLHHQGRFTARALHPGTLMMVSFLAAIALGTLLLKMPRCVVPGAACSWLDAWFTSTSAVCVTGLVVHDTATFFTFTGQVVILLLIQIGGLGIMTLTFFAAVVLFEGLTLHDRLLLGRMIHENRLSRLGRTLKFIVGMTFPWWWSHWPTCGINCGSAGAEWWHSTAGFQSKPAPRRSA